MKDNVVPAARGTAWWARLPSGDLRRIWVTKAGDFYHCAVEILTPEQEQARIRLARLGRRMGTLDGPVGERPENDAQLLAGIKGLVAKTADPREAFAFLGADDAALGALIEADAGLASIPKDAWSRPAVPENRD